MELRKFVAPEFLLGSGALKLAGQYAMNLAAKKILLVSDCGVINAGWIEDVYKSLYLLNLPFAIFPNVTPNPKDYEVMAGVETYKKENCDVIIAVGGGSVIDCAKGIGIVASNNKHILQFEGVDQIEIPMPPLICIPTTCGSSADISQFAIITDTSRNVKIAIVSKAAVPDLSLIDPDTTSTMPDELLANTGIDVLTHAIEAYVSNAASPITDIHALEAIRLVRANLKKSITYPDKLEFRNNMMISSTLAGLAFSNASLGLVHAMAHSLGGLTDQPHGECNALLLEHVVEFNFDAAPERYSKIAEIFGADQRESADSKKEFLIEKLSDIRKSVGIIKPLGELGLKKSDIPFLSGHAFNDPCLATNPKEVTKSDIERIYERAF